MPTWVLGAERINLLLIGHVVSSYNPVTMFLNPDPSVRYTMVPTTGSYAVPLGENEAKRHIKQYFPRTYDNLAGYDFIMYSIPYIVPLTMKQISWLIQVVETGECSALTDQGGLRMKGVNDLSDAEFWVSSGMSDVFANDAEKVLQVGKVTYSNAGYRVKVNREAQHQVLLPLISLGIEKIPALGLFHTIPKEVRLSRRRLWDTSPTFPAPRTQLPGSCTMIMTKGLPGRSATTSSTPSGAACIMERFREISRPTF